MVDIVWRRSEFEIRARIRARFSSSFFAFGFVGGVGEVRSFLSLLSLSRFRLGSDFLFSLADCKYK